jgi:hypothetical protein
MSMKADDQGNAIFALRSFMRAATPVTSGSPWCVRVETNHRLGCCVWSTCGANPLISQLPNCRIEGLETAIRGQSRQ